MNTHVDFGHILSIKFLRHCKKKKERRFEKKVAVKYIDNDRNKNKV